MSKHIQQEVIVTKARIVEAPTTKITVEVDRTFELPPALYAATAGLYLGFLAILAGAFGNPGLVLPMVIFTLVVVAAFGVPMVWTKLAPETKSRALTLGGFSGKGIMTHTGPLAPRDATIQVLILPVLILLWAVAVATIAATI